MGNRLTLGTVDTPHLAPLPERLARLARLAGGVYTMARSAAAPSSLTFEQLR